MSDLIIVLGKRGMGKSVYTRKWLADRDARPMVCYDPMRSIPHVEWYEDLTTYQGEDIDDEYPMSVGCYTPDQINHIPDIALWTPGCIVVLEEMATAYPKGARLSSDMARLVFLSRHYDIDMLFVAQRPSSIPIDVRSQATNIVSFAQHEGDDLSWMKDFYGKRVAEIPMLPRLHYLEYSDRGVDTGKVSIDRTKKHEYKSNEELEYSNILIDLIKD